MVAFLPFLGDLIDWNDSLPTLDFGFGGLKPGCSTTAAGSIPSSISVSDVKVVISCNTTPWRQWRSGISIRDFGLARRFDRSSSSLSRKRPLGLLPALDSLVSSETAGVETVGVAGRGLISLASKAGSTASSVDSSTIFGTVESGTVEIALP